MPTTDMILLKEADNRFLKTPIVVSCRSCQMTMLSSSDRCFVRKTATGFGSIYCGECA